MYRVFYRAFILFNIGCCFGVDNSQLIHNSSTDINNHSKVISRKPIQIEAELPTIQKISAMDNDQNQIADMKRKLEVAKIQQQIQQTTHFNSNTTINAKTVVTGVMINEQGSKLATLRFPDGGTFDVEIGSIIKNLKVID